MSVFDDFRCVERACRLRVECIQNHQKIIKNSKRYSRLKYRHSDFRQRENWDVIFFKNIWKIKIKCKKKNSFSRTKKKFQNLRSIIPQKQYDKSFSNFVYWSADPWSVTASLSQFMKFYATMHKTRKTEILHNFAFEEILMTTGNTISLTNFNETLTKRLLSPCLPTRKGFIEILWADFSKMKNHTII